jgi:hypothetical protein
MFSFIKKFFKKKTKPSTESETEKVVPIEETLTDAQLHELKIQYAQVIHFMQMEADQINKKAEEEAQAHNSVCQKCDSRNVNDRIKRVQGDIQVSVSTSSSSFYSSSYSSSNASVKGEIDTNEINKCNDCENEWKKQEMKPMEYSTLLSFKLQKIQYYIRAVQLSKTAELDKTNLSETFATVEEKRNFLKEAADKKYENDLLFWKSYSIELVHNLASKFFWDYESRYWSRVCTEEALRNVVGLKSVKEFVY